ncbi:MAG: helix-turn-helix domain-containing protein [Acidobacteriia bacterium]|nr:helix-turn-helix domain-containing protein [Terriglobia bacterium]
MLDVAGAAELLGVTEKVIRARAARMLLPHRRWGGRLVFVRKEIEEFFQSLPGCSKDAALQNVEARRGGS